MVHPINPGHDRYFSAAEDESRVGGRVVVNELKDVHTTLGNHREASKIHAPTDNKGAPPVAKKYFFVFLDALKKSCYI